MHPDGDDRGSARMTKSRGRRWPKRLHRGLACIVVAGLFLAVFLTGLAAIYMVFHGIRP